MYMLYVTEYDVTNISGAQPWNNMIIGKVDTSITTVDLYLGAAAIHDIHRKITFNEHER